MIPEYLIVTDAKTKTLGLVPRYAITRVCDVDGHARIETIHSPAFDTVETFSRVNAMLNEHVPNWIMRFT